MHKIKKNTTNGNEKVLIATIDIGSRTHMGYWRYGTADITPFEFSNTREGFERFFKIIWDVKIRYQAEKIIIGFESTGSYGEPLIHYLSTKESIELAQVNPMHTKRVKELGDNSPNKTDKKDPKVIADIISMGHYMSVIIPKGAAAELRQLVHARQRAIQKRTSAINQLHGLNARTFPELVKILRDIQSASALYLMEHYPLPADIVAVGREALTAILKEVSRGKISMTRAGRLYEAAQQSVGITEGTTSIRMEIRHLIAEIKQCTAYITEIETAMHQHVDTIPYAKHLLSIPRIGKTSIAIIIGEVGDFTAIPSSKALLKLAGLNLYEISSGSHKGNCHITKFGRALLRTILYFISLSLVRRGGIMHEYYQHLLRNGMKKIKALIAVSRKIVRIMVALVRDTADYCRDYSVHKVA